MKKRKELALEKVKEHYKSRKIELEQEAAMQIKQAKDDIQKAEYCIARYIEEEFAFYVKEKFGRVTCVRGGIVNGNINIDFYNACALRILQEDETRAYLSCRNTTCIQLLTNPSRSRFVDFTTTDERVLERLVLCADVFEDALSIVRDVVPRWFGTVLPKLDAEYLMTTRVLRWVSKQVGGQWPDVVAGHVVDKIQ